MPCAAQFGRCVHPGVEVLAAMAGRGVHEAGAGVVGDVIAGEHRDREIRSRRREPFERDAPSVTASKFVSRYTLAKPT